MTSSRIDHWCVLNTSLLLENSDNPENSRIGNTLLNSSHGFK